MTALPDSIHQKHDESIDSSLTKVSPISVDCSFINKSAHDFGHDVRSPLFVIRSYSYLLQRTQEKEKLERGFEMIESATYKIEKLINSYVKLIDLHTLPSPEYTQVSFQTAFQKAISLLSIPLEQQTISIQHDFAAAEDIHFNEAQLIDIFTALIDNSLRHNTEKNNLVISVTTRKKGKNTCLEIKDNGVGFTSEQEVIKSIQPFYSYTEDDNCVGIGLALVNGIAQTSKNKFQIESISNKYTSCRFLFSA